MNKKILILPPDSISNNISRAFFFAKYLAENNEVFIQRWADPQSLLFQQKKISKLATLKCFIQTLFQSYKVTQSDIEGLSEVYCSKMLFMVIYRFIGIENALKLSRWYNGRVIKKVAQKIKPDIIFYADGFDAQPLINGNWMNISDVQDDFDPKNFRNNEYQCDYGKENFARCDYNFVVSREAKRKLETFYDVPFHYVPNGVEISDMLKVDTAKLGELKNNLEKKIIISYVGGDAWVDNSFVAELLSKSLRELPQVHFLIVGNLVNLPFKNATFTGGLPASEAKLYYHASDIGIMLKSSVNSDFLRNSVPLKIIQYGVLNKCFIAPEISFLLEERFSNVTILEEYTPKNVLNEIRLKVAAKDLLCQERKWLDYDWNTIINRVEDLLVN